MPGHPLPAPLVADGGPEGGTERAGEGGIRMGDEREVGALFGERAGRSPR